MKEEISIFWFRRDLRLHDNAAFYTALKSKQPVLPIFIFDTNILDQLPENDPRVSFIYQSLQQMKQVLRVKANSDIALYYGTPLHVFEKITKSYRVKAVFTNRDYEPYARKRDEAIAALLKTKKIPFLTCKDQVIFENNDILKGDGTPYIVYTPYSKKWLYTLEDTSVTTYDTEPLFYRLIKNSALSDITLEAMGFTTSDITVPRYDVKENLIATYEANRDYPDRNCTSRLGPHLRFGTISIRTVLSEARKHQNTTFLKALIWREFFMQILWHFPHTITKSFKPQYDAIKWRNNENEFKQWCDGKTGYPLVDAGIRQLNTTGFMHNRVRMLTGSFLCKHLLIDWRWGEAYFAKKLLDYDMASNVGNWQWVAGCGVDAAPYFRIFNPMTQHKKFDPNSGYVRQWVPDIDELTYPSPIVAHKFARERCLKVYKAALNSTL